MRLCYIWEKASLSLKGKRNQKELENSEFIDLYIGDESHFGLTPNVPYVWQTKENPRLLSVAKCCGINEP